MEAGHSAPAYAPSSNRPLKLALLAAGLGSLVILLSFFGPAGSVAGLVLMVLGTVMSAAAARGASWWTILVTGSGISILAALVQLANDTLGGLIAVIGGILVLIGVALGYPLRRE